MRQWVADVRYAWRQLRRSPMWTLTAVLTLALGIGANTAIFTLVHAVLLRNLPVVNPKMLVRLGDTNLCCYLSGKPPADDYSLFPYDLYQEMKAATESKGGGEFEQLAGMEAGHQQPTVRTSEPGALARSTRSEFVSGNYFETFGLKAYVGRLLQPSDDRPGAPPAVVLSYGAWQRNFGGRAGLVGATVLVNAHPMTVVGVTPPGFYGDRMQPEPPELYMPFEVEPVLYGTFANIHNRDTNWVYMLGRVRPGVALGPLQAKLDGILRGYLRTLKEYQRADERVHLEHSHLVLTPGGVGITRMQGNYKGGLRMLMAASALLLLIACANLANLQLVRGMSRAAEFSLRMAMGAARRRLVRQMLVESLVLAVLGGVAGLVVAYGGTRALLMLAFPGAEGLPISASPSAPVLLFSFGLSLLTGLVFGALPAWLNSRGEPAEALRGAHRATRKSSPVAQRVLVVLQAALSLVLLVGAGLLGKSLSNVEHQNFGIETANRVVVHLNPQAAGYTAEQLPAFYRELQDRVGALPGVERVALMLYSPLEGNNWGDQVYREGRPEPGVDQDADASYVRVTPEFFPLLGLSVVKGRPITASDTADTPGVAVVNQAFVRKFFAPGEDPVGKRFGKSGMKSVRDFTIVGVVGDSKYNDPEAEAVTPMYFRPFGQVAASDHDDVGSLYAYSMMLETKGPVAGLEGEVQRVMASINPDLPMIRYTTMDDQVRAQLNQRRLLARLTGLFGAVALLLAAVGLYGVTAYRVVKRTGEIGVRMALGAPRASVVRMVLAGALVEAGLGLALGLPSALGSAHLMRAQLWGVGAADPAVLGGAVGVLAVAAVIAGAIPAQRAASVDPASAMRAE